MKKEKLKEILEGMREYLRNELENYMTFDETDFNLAYDDAIFSVMIDEENNGTFSEED